MKHHRFHSSAAAFAAILFTSMPPASAATDYSVTVLECPIVFMYCENPSYLASNGLVAGLDFGASNPNFWGFGGQRLYSDPQPFTYGLTTSINKHGVALISANENGDGHFFWNNGVYSQVPANINHPNFPGKINDVGQIAVGLTNGHQALWDNGVLTDLGTISGGRFSVARRIGDNAEIVGYVNTEDGLKQAVLWANGAATALGVLPGDTTSEAWAINATGDVFGFSYGIDTARPFRWSNGVMTELAPAGLFNPPQSFGVKGAYAIDMNSRGQIIAVDSTTSDYRAFLWDDGVVTELNSKLGYVSGNKDLAPQ